MLVLEVRKGAATGTGSAEPTAGRTTR